MVEKKLKRKTVQPGKIKNVVKSLNVLDVDVSKIEKRLSKGRLISSPGDKAGCIINITCCIIDCSRCAGPDRDIYINPANRTKGFMFKLPEQAKNKEAPIFFVPEMRARTAFKIAHKSLKVPGGQVEGRLLGIAGEMLDQKELKKQKISPTASVISLTAVKGLNKRGK